MLINILYAVCAVFFVIGVITVISLILLKLLKPDKNDRLYAVSVFGKNSSETPVRISLIISLLSLLGLYGRVEIIAADDGMEEKEKLNLISAFMREDRVKICTKEEIPSIISEKHI